MSRSSALAAVAWVWASELGMADSEASAGCLSARAIAFFLGMVAE
jgi:hypothetical protein